MKRRQETVLDKIDCLGDFCPVPLLKAAKAAGDLHRGEHFMLVSDHSCVVESLTEYFAGRPFSLEVDEVLNGVWEITISRI